MTNLTSSEWAQWVQGIGTVAAAIIAIAAVLLQHLLERRRAYQADLGKVNAIAQLSCRAYQFIKNSREHCQSDIGGKEFIKVRFDEEEIADITAALDEFDIPALPRERLIIDMIQMRRAIRDTKERMGELAGLAITHNPTFQDRVKGLSILESRAHDAYSRMERLARDMTDALMWRHVFTFIFRAP